MFLFRSQISFSIRKTMTNRKIMRFECVCCILTDCCWWWEHSSNSTYSNQIVQVQLFQLFVVLFCSAIVSAHTITMRCIVDERLHAVHTFQMHIPPHSLMHNSQLSISRLQREHYVRKENVTTTTTTIKHRAIIFYLCGADYIHAGKLYYK